MNTYHESVLLQEAVEQLNVTEGGRYIDATLGGGGHTGEIITRGGIVLGIDQDEDAIEQVKSQNSKFKSNKELFVVRGNFSEIDMIAKEQGFEGVNGILFDLGVSSHHFDEASRGFSFMHDAPLDMRMDTRLGVTAADLVNGLNKGELEMLFTKFGEENFAKSIVKHILQAREKKPIATTGELAAIVKRAHPKKDMKVHPATRVFQALRIAVNDELNVLTYALPKALALLQPGGRLVVISFHSLEDRIVKHLFQDFARQGLGKIITDKPIIPTEEEILRNNRARSAKMRVIEKIGN